MTHPQGERWVGVGRVERGVVAGSATLPVLVLLQRVVHLGGRGGQSVLILGAAPEPHCTIKRQQVSHDTGSGYSVAPGRAVLSPVASLELKWRRQNAPRVSGRGLARPSATCCLLPGKPSKIITHVTSCAATTCRKEAGLPPRLLASTTAQSEGDERKWLGSARQQWLGCTCCDQARIFVAADRRSRGHRRITTMQSAYFWKAS